MRGYGETGGDLTLCAAGPDGGQVGGFPQGEPQRIDDDGLAGPGFTGQGGKARAELQVEFLDYRKAADVQAGQHVFRGRRRHPFRRQDA